MATESRQQGRSTLLDDAAFSLLCMLHCYARWTELPAVALIPDCHDHIFTLLELIAMLVCGLECCHA